MTPPRAVLFDLGNVLIHYHPEAFWKVLEIHDPSQQEMYRRRLPSIFIPFEKGEYGLETCLERLVQVFDGKYTRSTLKEAMASVLTTPIEAMEEIVRDVSKKVTTALVSNTNEFHYAYCQRVVPALKYLPRHFVSFRMGVMKPDRAFYEKVLSELTVDPEDTVFIDDIPANVEAAVQCGMKGIVFRSPELLKREIAEWDNEPSSSAINH